MNGYVERDGKRVKTVTYCEKKLCIESVCPCVHDRKCADAMARKNLYKEVDMMGCANLCDCDVGISRMRKLGVC